MATATGASVGRSSEAAGSSADHASEDSGTLFPPPESGLMRGYLGADLPGGKLWFVLSQERLSYFETEDSAEPLGTLRVDEVSSVHATKHGQKEFRLRIRSSSADGVEFERRLSQPLSERLSHRPSNTPGPLSTRSESALSRQSTPCRPHSSSTPPALHHGASSPARSPTEATAAAAAAVAQGGERIGRARAGRAEGVGRPSVWSRFTSFWHDVLPGNAGHAGEGGVAGRLGKKGATAASKECVLVAHTPFEVDAWACAIREAKMSLVSAACNQEWEHVRALARVGRDVNAQEEGNRRTALHYAAGYGDSATARALVQSGADVNARDRAGMTALGWACLKGRVEVAQLLLKANADPLIKAHTGVLVGKTAVTLARLHGTQNLPASHRSRSLVQMLLLHCGAACYTVHQMLGQGGFGRVIEVTRADTGDRFAMKAILKQGSASASTNAKVVLQAQVERRILSRISHPFIIDLHCAFQTADKLLLVLELCPGGDLKQHMSRCGRIVPDVAAFVAAQVLLALEYLHGRHILHRDIKLENVLLDGEGFVRLTDFNVAKIMEERRTYSMKGTLFCMAPEVILKKGHDAAADFWSYGVLIFEMVTGGPPFFSNDKQELKRRILGIDPTQVSLFFPPDVPTSCRMLLSQLFVRDPKHRLGARKQDVPLIKAHPFFGRINWERLHAKQMTSPLRAPIEAMLASRAVGGHKPKHALNSADQDMAPSYLSQQHSALVQGWDYVGDSK